jgi:membrane protease YdiL (CAAX protease family)
MVVMFVLAALLALTVLIDAGLLIAWAVTKDDVEAGRRPPIIAPRWSVVHVWIAGQIIVAATLVISLGIAIVVLLVKTAMSGGSPSPGRIDTVVSDVMVPIALLSLIPQNALLVAVPVWFINTRYGQALSAVGFKWPPSFREIRAGVLLGFLAIPLALLIEVAISAMVLALVGPHKFQELVNLTKAIGNQQFIMEALASPLGFALLLLGGGILAPIGEEFFFRGFLYNSAKRRWGLLAGTLISAVAFAVVHAGPLLMLAIIPVGILLAVAYERTGSLWVPILIHVTFNSSQLIYAKITGASV